MDWIQIDKLGELAEKKVANQFRRIARIAEHNQKKVLDAFHKHKVSDSHFAVTTGYGYDDFGRETLEKVYADVFSAEDALVRPQIISGTHAITISLFALLRPGDELLYITGKPYDTLEEVIGIRGENSGSLKDFGITYQHVPLTDDGKVNFDDVQKNMNSRTKVIGIQRSRGYADRPSFSVREIKDMIDFVKGINPECIVFVDNCYGEFVEKVEPTDVGADLIAGSLIKNPGGGIVTSGGYIVGKQKWIEMCANRLTAPGLGKETGPTLNTLRDMFQGLFLAPHIVGEALKGAYFTSAILEETGLETEPTYHDVRTDLIQSVKFPDQESMVAFCQSVQKASPVNSHVTPYPSPMPGYEHHVIMAAGTFIQGASLELTADGPVRSPYIAFFQGGLTYEHVKIAVKQAIKDLSEKALISINRSRV